jgi:protein-S-isoprenylcysteine O-methyltransferase Ste14
MHHKNSKIFVIATIKWFFIVTLFLFIQIFVFYVSAGQIFVLRIWVYFCIALTNYFISTVVLYKLNPELLVTRLKRKRKGSKLWDEILMRLSNLTIIIVTPAIAGLDVVRFHWSNLGVFFVLIGLVFVGLSSILLNWAMIVNKHFEPTVRIQKERNHKVITWGPYSIIRHPGYLAGILFAISIPLLIGSVFAFVPVGIYFVLMILRTWLEDKTLQKELDGYSHYARKVRFRLFPGLW